jgi:Ca-activated chloride channel family protein
MLGYGLKGSKEFRNNVALEQVGIQGNICGEFVELTVNQVYENIGKQNIDGIYSFPIPDTAVITGFEATLGGRKLKAMVEDREEAAKLYDEAVLKGINTLSLEEPNSGMFQFSIGQILPGESVKIKLSYMDRLIYENDSMKLIIPAIIVPRSMEHNTEEESHIKDNYKVSLNLLIEPLSKLKIESPTHDIEVQWEEDINLAKVTFSDNLLSLDKDLILIMKEEKIQEASGMIYKYQEDDEEKGILYLRFIPKLSCSEEEKPNNYMFLVDISESMQGEKIEEAKNALQLCIRNLSEGDSFNIVAFSSELEYFSEFGKVQFNEDNLRRASQWIGKLSTKGGANILEALKYALSESNLIGHSTILLFTDDMMEDENEIIQYVDKNIGDNRLFTFGIDTSANSYVINKLASVGYGRAEFIYEDERIDDVILRQFSRIENPQVDISEIDWGEVKVESTYPRTIDYLYDREPFSIFAKVSGNITGKVTVKGKVDEVEYIKSVDLDNLDLEENAKLILKVWSRNRIESIEEHLKGERGSTAEAMYNKIIQLSRESGIISTETSFVMLEEMEDLVLGMAITRIIPLKASEQTIKNIADAKFIESPGFVYKSANKIVSHSERKNLLLDKKYPREAILRIIALNQYADGSFANIKEEKNYEKIATTARVLLGFTIGKEDILLYKNQLNKSIKYLIQNMQANANEYDESLYTITALALKAALEKDILNDTIEKLVKDNVEMIKTKLYGKSSENILRILDNPIRKSLKDIARYLFKVSRDGKYIEETLTIKEEKDSIDSLAKLSILKAL